MDEKKSATLHGLSEKEIERSREKYGENRLSKQKQKGFFRSFLESFGDPVIRILLIALAVNIIFLANNTNWFETIGIALAILLATLVSTLSEKGSEDAFKRLQEEASRTKCIAKRSGGFAEIPVIEVVVGDIIKLQQGDKIPADGVLLQGELSVDQAALNGESKEAKKHTRNDRNRKRQEGETDFLNPEQLFSGTIVCSGGGIMRVTHVGDGTFYGKIGSAVQKETRESPLKVRLASLAKSIGRLGYIAAALTAIAYFINVFIIDCAMDTSRVLGIISTPQTLLGHIFKACTLAVTVIVMAVPEGLPMMITVVLSANMRRMLKDKVLVRKLVGIETAGSLNILFTDKTGTLTRGNLSVTNFISGDGKLYTKKDIFKIPDDLSGVLKASICGNTDATLSGGQIIGGNATDRAALSFAHTLQKTRSCPPDVKLNSVPFTSEAKFMATTVRQKNGKKITYIKGAPEKILPHCSGYYNEHGKRVPLGNKSALSSAAYQLSAKAIRLIAVAISEEVAESPSIGNLVLVGILGIRDEIRSEAVTSVSRLRSAGIQTVMITGDSKETAVAIADEIELTDEKGDVVLTSAELKKLSDSKVAEVLPRLRVVARALPEDKSRLVKIAQNMGLVTGMTGDGVNDAPALKKADVGFSMGSGTEVAKEAGDIVILNDSLSSVEKAVCYGRTIFKSIRKFIIYQLSICLCAVGVTVVGPLLGIDAPITVVQMLWINMVMDTLAGLAFSGEKARIKYMEEPPKRRNEAMMNSYMKTQIAVNSLYTTVMCLIFLKSSSLQSLLQSHGAAYVMTAFFGLFMFVSIFMSFCTRTHNVNLLSYLAANKAFIFIMALVAVIQVLILYLGGPVFRTVLLAPRDVILITILAATIIPVDLLRKFILRRRIKGGT